MYGIYRQTWTTSLRQVFIENGDYFKTTYNSPYYKNDLHTLMHVYSILNTLIFYKTHISTTST